MVQQAPSGPVHERSGHFRFAVIGQLLASPPAKGELAGAIAALAAHICRHPISAKSVRVGFSTIERWYYGAPEGEKRSRRRRIGDLFASLHPNNR